MPRTIAPAEKVARDHLRGSVLRILEREVLLTEIRAGGAGRFVILTQEWPAYWEPVVSLDLPELDDRLGALHRSWQRYIGSGFAREEQCEFCFRFFTLIDELLDECENKPGCVRRMGALRRALAFECFAIIAARREDGPGAAGTTTLRNPCYLVAKLKSPDGPDDPRFKAGCSVERRGETLWYGTSTYLCWFRILRTPIT